MMRLEVFKGVLFFVVLFRSVSGFGEDVIVVTNTETQLVGEKVVYFKDETNTRTLRQMMELKKENRFESVSRPVFARPSSAATHWFSFTVQSELSEEIWVNVFNQGFDYISFYLLDENDNLLDVINTGALLPPETRQRRSKTFWFNLFKPSENGTRTVFLKIDFSGILEVPIIVGGLEEQVYREDESEIYGILFIGALVIMLLYNGSLWYFTGDKVYAFYFGYILFVMFLTAHVNNYPITPGLIGREFTYNYLFTWISPIALFIALFTINYLQLDIHAKRWARAVMLAASTSLLIGVLNLFIPSVYLTNFFQLSTGLLLLVCLYVGYNEWWKGNKRARFYAVGWTINFLSVFTFIGVSNGVVPFSTFSRNVMYVSVLVELIIFSVALADRLNQLKNEQLNLNVKLEEANARLREINASLDTFNYHVSHDLKTVLNNTVALARMAAKYNKIEDSGRVAEIVDKLEGVAQNGVETVQSFLSFGKIDSLLGDKNIGWIVLEDEIKEVIFQHNLEVKIDVSIVENDIRKIKMHQKVFESIFLNFFTNTIKYNKNEPKAWVRFRKEGNNYLFEYEDNGIGIDLKKYGSVLFEPFQRATGSESKEGTGVGLYLVKRIIDNFKGTIDVKSHPGEGTTFRIKLPLTEE